MECTQAETTSGDAIKKMEDEHLRLQRQVRIIQMDRLHRTMGVHPQHRKQDKLLHVLKKEYVNLLKDLKIARSGAHKKNDKKMKKDLKKTLLERMVSENECEEGVTIMNQLDTLLHKDNRRYLHMKKLVIASRGQLQKRQYQSENRLVSTENKLEAANLRFNTVQYENKKIREEIEHMLKDRALFNQEWAKMLKALNKGKKFLTDLFESSTVAYDQRDEWCTKLQSLMEKGKMDQILQVQEMRGLQKSFDHDMKIHDFLSRKGVKRINKKQEENEEEMKIKEIKDIEKEIQFHVKLLDDIYEYTGIYSPDTIVETTNMIETKNMTTYRLLTEICATNEVLKRDVKRIRQNIADRKDYNEKREENRQEHLRKLNNDIEEITKRTDELRIQHENRVEVVNKTMGDIHDIFKMLDCSTEPFQNLLGDKQPSVWQFNLTMSLITENIKDLVHTVYYYERHIQKKNKTTTSRLKKYTVQAKLPTCLSACPINLLVPAEPCPSCIEARWMSRVSDVPEVPLDRASVLAAVSEISSDPSFERSDRVHAIIDCRLPHSRAILAKRYL